MVFHHSLNFDEELPHYGTRNGVLRHDDPLVVTSPPLMWVEALDVMMQRVSRERAFDPARIAAIGGCAQQHGTVYLNQRAARAITTLDASKAAADQLAGIFSRPESPVWMDESTGAQCVAIAGHLVVTPPWPA